MKNLHINAHGKWQFCKLWQTHSKHRANAERTKHRYRSLATLLRANDYDFK